MAVLWFIAGFTGIELLALLIHKYLMHGPLWFIHSSHHRPKARLEWNDLFALLFGGIGVWLLISGSLADFDARFWTGLGISVYGGVYFFLHDVLVHRRAFKAGSPKNVYLRALRHAHRMHHKHVNKQPGESYGLLFFHWRYFRESQKPLG
jgi:beta-carotene 3-hydroxylase